MSMTSTAARRISVTRENEIFRLTFPPDPGLLERVRSLPFAHFDGDTRSWTTQVCTQSVAAMRGWYYEGLMDNSVDDLIDETQIAPVAAALLRRGTMKRPYRVLLPMRNENLFAQLKGISGSTYEKESRSFTFPSSAAAALGELERRDVISDPEHILNPARVMIVFDTRTGRFVVTGDERATSSFDQHFPARDVVTAWQERGNDVAFVDSFTEEVYRGELARARGAISVEGFKADLWPYQGESVAVALERRGFGVFHEMGLGKGECHGTPVLTPSGWVKIEDIHVGDFLIGADGRRTKVTGVYPRGMLLVYEVRFDDGTTLTVDGDHLWSVQHVRKGHRHPEEWRTLATRDIMSSLREGPGSATWRIPLVKAVEFEKGPALFLDPYLLGLLLGGGTLGTDNTICFTSADEILVEEVEKRLGVGLDVVRSQLDKKSFEYRVRSVVHGGEHDLIVSLDALNLRKRGWEKHIPEIYLRASVDDRWALLRGLMDTGATVGPDGTSEYVSVSKELADGVGDLVQGLGGVVRRSTKQPTVKNANDRVAYIVHVTLSECPFLLSRKAEAWHNSTTYPPDRIITSIEPIGEDLVTCIAVDAPDHLYVTDHYIVTHNTVIALAAGHELLFNRESVTRVVVVVPGAIRSQWAKEIARFSDGKVVVVDGDAKKRAKAYAEAKDAQWLVVHYDVLSRDLRQLTPLVAGSLLIADEAHRLKSPKAARTKAMRTMADRAGRRLALSGTPVLNDPGEWFSVISGFVAPGCFGNPIDFLNRYSYPNRWNGFEGARNLSELADRSATYYTRYTKAEVATHLPPLRIKSEVLDVDPAYRAALVRAHREARLEIKAAAVDRAVASGKLGVLDGDLRDDVETGAEMTAVGMLRLLCLSPRVVLASDSPAAQALFDAGLLPDADGPKIEKLLDIAGEAVAAGQRVAVFSSSKRMVYLMAERLGEAGIRCVTFTGDTNRKDRDAAVEAFTAAPTEDNPGPTAFLATDAGGEGLNLGAQCSLLVNMDIPWTPGALAQRSARIHRIDGTAERYLVINLTLRGTIEEGILRMVEHKADLVDAIFSENGGRMRTTGRKGRSVFETAMEEWDERA